MSQYKGSNLDKVMPQVHTKNYPKLTNDQVKLWWETFSSGIGADEEMGTKFEKGRNLYIHTDDHRLIRAVNEGESLDNPAVQRRLLEGSLNGRLFTRKSNDDYIWPRQVVTDPEDFSMGVAISDSPYSMPTPEWPDRPNPLPFWKYLLWPFSSSVREEVRTYQNQKTFYDTTREQIFWLEKFKESEAHTSIISDDIDEDLRPIREAREAARQQKEMEQKKAEMKAEREAFLNEHNQKKQEWNKDVSTMSLDEYEKYRDQIYKDSYRYNNIVRDIIKNKHATYEEVLDGVVRVLETGLIRATSSIMYSSPEMILLQRKPYQEAKAGLREYALKHIDENLIKTALEAHEWSSDTINALLDSLENMQQKLSEDTSYLQSKGVLTDPENVPLKVRNQAERLKHYRKAHGEHITHLDESPESYREQHNQRKEKWNQDVSKMTLDEFMKYRKDLINYSANNADYFDIVTHPHATVDDVYDFIARDMEVVIMMEQTRDDYGRQSDLMYTLDCGRMNDFNGIDLRTDFAAIQQEPWQKVKDSMQKWARENVSKQTVENFLKKHNYDDDARYAFADVIRKAYNNVKGNFRNMGIIFDKKELTPEVVKNMLVSKYQREGKDAIKNLSDTLKQQLTQQNGPQQPAPQAQVQNDAPKKEQGGHTI